MEFSVTFFACGTRSSIVELSGRIVLNRQYFSQIDLSLNKYYQFNQINPFDPEMTRKQSKKSYNIKIFGSCECCGILCSIIFVGAMRSSIVEFRVFFHMWNKLWYCAIFQQAERALVMSNLVLYFLCVERALVLCNFVIYFVACETHSGIALYFLRVKCALVLCNFVFYMFCVWNTLWYCGISCHIFCIWNALWYRGISCSVFMRVERALVLWIFLRVERALVLWHFFVIYFLRVERAVVL